eukprot:TRINITY_DN10367_c1_g1_i3.p2 TRINITY_DN10367_c1_g1~~TRINITY_DN10367_c1_g1_i3.p2  ORF type:complete len:281 (-),score=48.97 TRINITY_DN10367_c1_g1_i3:3001-3843(-)
MSQFYVICTKITTSFKKMEYFALQLKYFIIITMQSYYDNYQMLVDLPKFKSLIYSSKYYFLSLRIHMELLFFSLSKTKIEHSAKQKYLVFLQKGQEFFFPKYWLKQVLLQLQPEQWPDFGCEGIKVQRAHQPTSQCQGKKNMLKRAGMSAALTRGTNITVFAPEDEGLSIILEALGNHVDMLEMEGLQAWMGYHVIHGIFYEEDLFPGTVLPTYTMSENQTPLEIEVSGILGGEGDGLLIKSVGSDARTAEPPLKACGGVVHIMDVPLMPVAASEAHKRR